MEPTYLVIYVWSFLADTTDEIENRVTFQQIITSSWLTPYCLFDALFRIVTFPCFYAKKV